VCSGEPCTTETHRLFVWQNFSHSLQVTSCHISFPQSASFLSALYTILAQAIINSADSNVELPVCSYSQKLHTSGLYQLPTSYPVVASNSPSRAVALATTGLCIQENHAPLKHNFYVNFLQSASFHVCRHFKLSFAQAIVSSADSSVKLLVVKSFSQST